MLITKKKPAFLVIISPDPLCKVHVFFFSVYCAILTSPAPSLLSLRTEMWKPATSCWLSWAWSNWLTLAPPPLPHLPTPLSERRTGQWTQHRTPVEAFRGSWKVFREPLWSSDRCLDSGRVKGFKIEFLQEKKNPFKKAFNGGKSAFINYLPVMNTNACKETQ